MSNKEEGKRWLKLAPCIERGELEECVEEEARLVRWC